MSVKKDLFKKAIDKYLPKMNPNIMNGLSREWMESGPSAIDEQITGLMKNTDKSLTYMGYRMLNAEEQHAKMVNNAGEFDITKNNLTLWSFEFNFNEKPIRNNFVIFLPYMERGDMTYISNTLYHFTPILSTGIITPYPNKIFILMSKDKFFIERYLYTVTVDGVDYPLDIIYSNGLNRKVGKEKPVKTPILMYALARYGLSKYLELFLPNKKFEIVDLTKELEYDKEKYHLIKSTGKIPEKFKGRWELHHIGFLIEKDCKKSMMLATALLLVFDYIPVIAKQLVKLIGNANEVDHWQTAFVKLMFLDTKEDSEVGKQSAKLKITLNNYDIYMDEWTKHRLHSVGYFVDTFYAFLVKMSEDYNYLTINNQKYMADINNRYLDIVYNINYDIKEAINMLFLKLNNNYLNESQNSLTVSNVEKHFRPTNAKGSLARGIIKGIVGGRNGAALALEVVNKSNDDLFSGLTGSINLRERGEGTKKATKRKSGKSNVIRVNPTDPFIGSALALRKSYPSPLLILNPFVDIDMCTGKFILTDDKLKTVDVLKSMLEEDIDRNRLEEVANLINESEEDIQVDVSKSLED